MDTVWQIWQWIAMICAIVYLAYMCRKIFVFTTNDTGNMTERQRRLKFWRLIGAFWIGFIICLFVWPVAVAIWAYKFNKYRQAPTGA